MSTQNQNQQWNPQNEQQNQQRNPQNRPQNQRHPELVLNFINERLGCSGKTKSISRPTKT